MNRIITPQQQQSQEQQLGLWQGQDGYVYFVVRLHDEDENRLKEIEAKIDRLQEALDKLLG